MERFAGSSPLARGLPPPHCGRGSRGRIIPARAGFTSRCPRSKTSRRDHPRSRGVYRRVSVIDDPSNGSSPLARGLHPVVLQGGPVLRIIPARAGFTLKYTTDALLEPGSSPLARGLLLCIGRLVRCRGIIPARAGFTRTLSSSAGRFIGSSPLARGLRGRRRGGGPARGIIPARAGFTFRRRCRRGGTRDHPRSRGVYRGHGSFVEFSRGSSPLARGLPD